MKYKNIPSMLHNFGHSFMSLINYVDGDYAIDLLKTALEASSDHRLEIHFPKQRIDPPGEYSPKLRKSVALWADSLPKHMASHGVDVESIRELVLVIVRDVRGIHCRVRATDDRGKDYDVPVARTA